MSKKSNYYKNGSSGKKYQAVLSTTEALTKKGKLKGKNKKQTKLLKAACCHHVYNRKGKLRPTYHDNSHGNVTCELCGRSFSVMWADKDKINDIIKPVLSYMDQAAAGAVAGNLGEKAVDTLVHTKVAVTQFPKNYEKVMKVLHKASRMKKKKNRNNNGGGSTQYGSWIRSNRSY